LPSAAVLHKLRHKAMVALVRALLAVAAPFCLALGLTLPLVRFEKFYFFSDTPSLLDIVGALWRDGNAGLSVVVALFSVAFPVAKLLTVSMEVVGGAGSRAGNSFTARALPVLAKWSMMDVLLVALAIVAAKTSGLASAFTQPGLWFYAASAVCVTLLNATVRRKV
jgi:paraquat-inducible protein A